MNQYQIVPSERFRKDLKKAARKGYRVPQILRAVRLLAAGAVVEMEYRDRAMPGEFSNYRVCRIEPGCELVYRYEEDRLILYFLMLSGAWRGTFMLYLTEVKYHLFRNKGKSILMVLMAALFTGCMAFYVGNISASQRALDTLSESTPATFKLTNLMMDSFDHLRIRSGEYDLLVDCGLKNIMAASINSGKVGEISDSDDEKDWNEIQEQLLYEMYNSDYMYIDPGDTSVLGISSLAVAEMAEPKRIQFAEDADATLFTGDEALCVISEAYRDRMGLSLGDPLSMQLFQMIVNEGGVDTYREISQEKTELRVAGVMETAAKPGQQADVYVPISWLRRFTEENGQEFYYTSFSASLADSMKLNEFKDWAQDMDYSQPLVMERAYSDPYLDRGGGKTLFMDDEDFIKTAEKLGGAVQAYQTFLLPFFVLIIFLITLAVFLILRSARHDMAVVYSLGRSKFKIGCSYLAAMLLEQLAGCLLALPAVLLLSGVGASTALWVYGIFLLCAFCGDYIGLLALLRFDGMSLLLQMD